MSNTKVGGEYGDVRANIPVDSLNQYLAANVTEIHTPVDVKQFQYGQSNPTYFLTDTSGTRYVLRKKPAGELLSPTAHAIEREHFMLSALHAYNQKPSTPPSCRIPIPRPISLCTDKQVIGTPFYIMEFLEGRIFSDPRMPQADPAERKQLWLSAVRTLALLGALDPDAIGLAKFGAHTPYYPRQIKSLTRVSNAQAAATDVETGKPVGDIPYYKESLAWYSSHLPDETKTGTRIVHGDYKIDNLIFHPTEPRVIGILDWELCTLGSPLSDLGNMTVPFHFRHGLGVGTFAQGMRDGPVPITFDEVMKEYCRVTRAEYPIKEMPFVSSWMLFRLAIILQGIAARVARRQASSATAEIQAKMFHALGELAREVYLSAELKESAKL